jgi:hypothetical protein
MLQAFLGSDKVVELYRIPEQDSGDKLSEQLLFLSRKAFDLFVKGRLSMRAMTSTSVRGPICTTSSDPSSSLLRMDKTCARYMVSVDRSIESAPGWASSKIVSFNNTSTGFTSPPNPLLLEINHRISKTLSWMEVAKYMGTRSKETWQGKPRPNGPSQKLTLP